MLLLVALGFVLGASCMALVSPGCFLRFLAACLCCALRAGSVSLRMLPGSVSLRSVSLSLLLPLSRSLAAVCALSLCALSLCPGFLALCSFLFCLFCLFTLLCSYSAHSVAALSLLCSAWTL